MIKKIHYCWCSADKPPSVEANIAKWKNLNPDFEFFEWNTKNIDVSGYEFGRQALQEKRWSFLSDIVRLQALYAHGGFYMDCDIELIRPLSALEAEEDDFILGYLYDCSLGASIFYSPPGHPVIAGILNEYHDIRPGCWVVNNSIFTDYFINNVSGFLLNGRRWKSQADKISLYPKEFFEQPAFVREQGISIHHANGSWMPAKSEDIFATGSSGYSHKSKWLKRKIRVFQSLLRSEYREAYFKALFGTRVHKTSDWKMGSEKV